MLSQIRLQRFWTPALLVNIVEPDTDNDDNNKDNNNKENTVLRGGEG